MKQIKIKLFAEDESNLLKLFNAGNNPFHTINAQSNVIQSIVRRKGMVIIYKKIHTNNGTSIMFKHTISLNIIDQDIHLISLTHKFSKSQ